MSRFHLLVLLFVIAVLVACSSDDSGTTRGDDYDNGQRSRETPDEDDGDDQPEDVGTGDVTREDAAVDQTVDEDIALDPQGQPNESDTEQTDFAIADTVADLDAEEDAALGDPDVEDEATKPDETPDVETRPDIVTEPDVILAPDVTPDPCAPAEPAGCFVEGDQLIRTSFEARAFLDTGCTWVKGDLLITGNDSLSNLDGLANLRRVDGDVIINESHSLVDMAGLSELGFVGGDIIVGVELAHGRRREESGNSSLVSVTLVGLSCLPGDLWVSINQSLTDVMLPNLESVGGDVWIFSNQDPNHLFEFPPGEDLRLDLSSLRSIGGDLVVSWSRITNLDSLSSLVSVGRDLWIGTFRGTVGPERDPLVTNSYSHQNSRLVSVSGLSSLESVGGTLSIRYNVVLATIGGESGGLNHMLNFVGGDLTIQQNEMLPNCEAQYLRDRLLFIDGIGDTTDVSYNDTEATCTYYP